MRLGPQARKVFIDAQRAGESTEYWEDEWSRVSLADVERRQRLRPDVTMRLLHRFVPQSGRILEAGTGASTLAAALRSPTRTVVGIDLTARALISANRQWPDLPLARADIRAMPFKDGSFDCVISLGVVEHLEEGPTDALREHARVLTTDGVLLVSVPWISLTKWVKDRWRLGVRRRPWYPARHRLVTNVHRPGWSAGPGRFHQYEFGTSLWHRYLEDAGLEVSSDHRHLVSAGIGELGLRGRPVGPDSESSGADFTANADAQNSATERSIDRLRRVAIREDPSNALDRLMSSGAQRALGHMILSVARRR